MKFKKNNPKRSNPSRAQRGPRMEEIANCAYLIWEKEGRPAGRDVEFWLQAEAQLRISRPV
jgi:hypothetical protein